MERWEDIERWGMNSEHLHFFLERFAYDSSIQMYRCQFTEHPTWNWAQDAY